MEPTVENNSREVVVCVENELGLHARPAGKVAQIAQKFQAEIALCVDDQKVDAKSILDILSLAAPQGTEICIKASGTDANAALEELSQLFDSKFEGDA